MADAKKLGNTGYSLPEQAQQLIAVKQKEIDARTRNRPCLVEDCYGGDLCFMLHLTEEQRLAVKILVEAFPGQDAVRFAPDEKRFLPKTS